MKKQRYLIFLFIFFLAFLIIGFIRNVYYLHLVNLMIIYSLFALGLNILTGFTGITSFGHAGFFAVGAYTSAILTTQCSFPTPLSLCAASLVTGVIGYLIGLPVIRISGIYLAMVTLGFAEFIRLLAINCEILTGGPLGISNIPTLSLFGFPLDNEMALFWFLYSLLILATFVFIRIVKSRFGYSLRAIKDSESAAESIGIPCAKNKMMSFFISGLYSGLAGALYAHFDRFISPDAFQFDLSILVLCMVVVGGMGSVIGSILGAIVLVVLLELFQPFGDYRLIVYGALLMIMITYFPEGLIGILNQIHNKIFGKKIHRVTLSLT